MRTFVALDLPLNIKEDVAEVIDNFRSFCSDSVNWVPLENLHITFQFIGETKEEDLPEIAEFITTNFPELSPILFTEPKLEIIPGRDPKIIWISLKTENSLIRKISKKLKEKLRKIGYKIDSKPLRFHITLGRIKKRLPENAIKEILTTELKLKWFEVSNVMLYKSLLKPHGPQYNELLNYKF